MKDYVFNGQRPNESVEEVVKNHWYVLFWPIVKTIILIAIPIVSFIYIGANVYFSIITAICVILAFTVFSTAYYLYSSSVFLITSERIIYLYQKTVLKRKVIETNLEKIQDVTSDTEGLVKNALDFGDLIIRTAGAGQGGEIVVKNIPSPYTIQQEITKRVGKTI